MAELSDEDVGLLSDDQVGVGSSGPASSAMSDADVGLMSDDEVGIGGQAEGPAMSAARSGANAILPGAAALSGFGVGAEIAAPTAPFTYGIGPVVGGLVGAGIAAYGASKIQGGIKEAVGLDDSAQVALNAEAHPVASAVGETIGGMAGMGPGGTLAQRAIGAGLQTAVEGGQQVYRGEFDPARLAIAAGGGALLPTPNRLGQAVENAGRAVAGKFVPGRPGRVADPAADTAHQAVGEAATEDPHASAFGEAPPSVGDAQVETTGNPQSAPTRSDRDYGKGKDTTPPEGDMLSQGDVAPDVGAALKEAAPAPEPAPEPASAPEPVPEPQAPQQPAPPPEPAVPPAAAAAINQSKGRLSLKPRAPEPVVEAGFPKEGEPVAVGENEATKLPRNETAINASVTDAQLKAGNYPKERTHDFGKPQRIETYAGDTRRGVGAGGEPWEHASPYDYGYFNKTIGKDKDHIDFARPPKGHPDRGDKQFVIDQKNLETGKFDEHKVFTDYKDEAAARQHFEDGFGDGKGAERLGAIKEVTRPELVKWLAKHTNKPANKPFSMVEEAKPAAKPVAERAVVKDLIAKGKTTPEAIAALPAEQVEAAIAGKRTRKYGVGTGASAGYPVEGLLNSEGKPVTANTKIKALARSNQHMAVEEAFGVNKARHDQGLLKAEADGALLDRLRGSLDTARSNHIVDGKPTDPLEGWKPTHKPASWMWAREAKKVLAKPTKGNITKFREAERLLTGAPEDVGNYRSTNRTEADIARSKRGGDEAVANAEAKNVDLGRNTVEDDAIAAIDAKRDQEFKTMKVVSPDAARVEAIDAKRGGRFDVPHEEAETMVEPKPVKSAADLKEIPHRTMNSHDAALGKIDTNAISKKALSEADAALVGRKGEKNVPSEDRKTGDEGRKIKFDDNEKARIMAEMNKAAKRNDRARGDLDALPPERDPDIVPSKRARDLLDRVINEGKGFIGDETGSIRPGAIAADIKRLMDNITSPIKGYVNQRPALKRALSMDKTMRKSFFAAERDGAVEDYWRSLGEQFRSNKGENENHILRLKEEGNESPLTEKQQEEIYHARQADSAGIKPANGAKTNIANLSPELQAAFHKHVKPLLNQSNRIDQLIRQEFPDHEMGPRVPFHTQRVRAGDQAKYNMLLPHDDDVTQPGFFSMLTHPGTENERSFYALERVADGKRVVIAPTKNGYNYHVKGKIHKVTDPKFEFEDGKAYKAGAHDTIMRQATDKEIEKHVVDDNGKPMEYYHNAGFSAALTNLQLGTTLRNLRLLEGIRSSPEFQKLSVPERSARAAELKKEGWAEPNLPNFKGTLVHPSIKMALDDATGSPKTWLQNISGAITKTMFWVPIAHMMNEVTHWFTGRGGDWLNPAAYARMAKTMPEAFKSVINQDAYQAALRTEGAGMVLASVLTRKPTEQLARAFQLEMKQPARAKQWQKIADTLGVPLKALHGAVYDNSQKVLWASHDILLTQRVKELEMTGLTMKQAIVEAQRDIPAYILPIKIMGSRVLQQMMGNNPLLVFGRYHYGMWNSYANQFKDLLSTKATMGDRLDAAGKLMATAMLVSVVYPYLFDRGAKAITGNPDAEANRRGPSSIPSKLLDALHGKADLSSALRSSLTVSPAVTTALEEYYNRDFRGKPIRQPGDVAGTAVQKGRAVVATASHVAKGLISPLSTFSTGAAKDESALGTIRDQFTDVKNPSDATRKWNRLKDMHNQRDTLQDFRRNKDPFVQLYNRWTGYK